jgi:hypothetical protein
LIAESKDFEDPEVPYMFHYHFLVVKPGTDVPTEIPNDESDHQHR